jgi:hypothetical protein
MHRPTPLTDLARTLAALPPSCGHTRLVAVDGHAGSGKSTFAGLLAAALGRAPVLPLDSLATHEELFAWTGRLEEQVTGPLRRGEPARYRPYDWHTRCFGAPLVLPAAPVVLVEGVGSGRAALRPDLACLLWMDVPRADAWRRGRRRDGPALAGFWDTWERAERAHFAADPSRPFAHARVQPLVQGAFSGHSRIAAGSPAVPAAPGAPPADAAYAILPGPAGPCS